MRSPPSPTCQRCNVRMAFDQNMGELYPFSLKEKLAVITENSPFYLSADNPFDHRSSRWKC
jgi:hypothetical protein